MSKTSQDESLDISNEDIKHLVFRSEPAEIKYPMYRSKFSEQVREEMKKGRDCHKTMGYAYGFNACPPEQYLKKRSRKVYFAQVERPEPKPGTKAAAIPKKDEWNEIAPRVEQNHLINNIRKAVRSVPPTGPSRVFDTALGRRVHNCNLLIPTFTWSKNYGKVPDYIQTIKQQLKDKSNLSHETPNKDKLENISKAGPAYRMLSANEREELLKSLKGVWAELQRDFQVLPVLNDTPPKVKRKESLEAKLIEIEKDIKMIEENEQIIVEEQNGSRCAKSHEPDPCYQHLNYAQRKK